MVIIFAFLDLGKNISFSDSLLGQREGIPAVSQYAIKVYYEGEIIGEYFADINLATE